ncbi:WH2 motif [Popillia japonica]|uniref:WH2 motif n=1 Tax=Popillia japonica TaxID=7064 RepID=A0AAW1IZZ7_POPJA
MPTDKGSSDSGGGSKEKGESGRTASRPPWVKEGPNPLPVPTMPWTLNKRNSLKDTSDESSKLVVPALRKVKKPEPQENGTPKKETFTKPQLKPIPPKEAQLQSKEVKIPIPKLNSVKDRELPPPVKRNSIKEDVSGDIDKAMPATRNALVRQESLRKVPGIPVAPPLPPPAPALPNDISLSDKQKEKIAMLRSRPKTRPDWSAMLKEVESQRTLKHVECNDRSEPLLPKAKAKGQFLYDSEKQNAHNDLLKQIEVGIKLKKVKTNDRSKPMLEGLRKFRRQMTIEEQIIKSQSMASMPPEEIADETDEMDDIDKVRDDLQSTKQLLAFEMRNKEAQIRENRKLLAKIQQLEAELEKERQSGGGGGEGATNSATAVVSTAADEKMIKSLKSEVEEARKTAEELEKKYSQGAEELDSKKMELEEQKKINRELEKKILELTQGKRQSIVGDGKNEDEEEEFVMSESESDGEDTEEKRQRRAQREIKLFRNKLKSYKNKEDNAKKERIALKEQMKTHQLGIKEEKKKYKALQKEVDKMASLMKESSEDEDDEDEDEEEESEKEEESESESESSESESETSESETESEKSQSEPEDAPIEKIKDNLSVRSKRHENLLAALKKGNLMLKANVERLQDDLNKQKELTMALQEDLDSVLAELG